MGLTVIPREEWGAWDAWSRSPREPPANTVLCSYIETQEGACRTIANCREFMKRIQREHIRLDKLQDVPYNFVIGGDGNAYEGRGWLLEPELGENEREHRGKNLYIGVCGRENGNERDPKILETLEELLRFGSKYEFISKDFKTVHIPHFVPKGHNIALEKEMVTNDTLSSVNEPIKRDPI